MDGRLSHPVAIFFSCPPKASRGTRSTDVGAIGEVEAEAAVVSGLGTARPGSPCQRGR